MDWWCWTGPRRRDLKAFPYDWDWDDAGLIFHNDDEHHEGNDLTTDAEKALAKVNRIITKVDDDYGHSFTLGGEDGEGENLAAQGQPDDTSGMQTYTDILLSTADHTYSHNYGMVDEGNDSDGEDEMVVDSI